MTATATKNTEALMPNGVPVSFHEKFEREQAEARAWATKEGYALSGLKVFEAGSEETTCFVSNITKNGVKVGDAKNEGHGGSTMVWVKGTLSVKEADMLETFVDSEVELQGQKKWMDRQSKSMAKKGVDFVLFFKVGSAMNVIGDYGKKEVVVANAVKQFKSQPVAVIDLTATSAKVRAELDAVKNAKWQAKAKEQFKAAGCVVVVFYVNDNGAMGCKGFRGGDASAVFAATVKNPKVVAL